MFKKRVKNPQLQREPEDGLGKALATGPMIASLMSVGACEEEAYDIAMMVVDRYYDLPASAKYIAIMCGDALEIYRKR